MASIVGTLEERILKTLKELGDEEFVAFKWHLRQPVNLEGRQPLPKSSLEKSTRTATVDLIIQAYHRNEAQIMLTVLRKINRNDLLESFPDVLYTNYRHLTLDSNTVNRRLRFENRAVQVDNALERHSYPDHPHRFVDSYDGFRWSQVLCTEGLTGRCYWQVKWIGDVSIAVTYSGIDRSGTNDDCKLGFNDRSWSLRCNHTDDEYTVRHNEETTDISVPLSSSSSNRINRVTVYLDYPAGTLSFYRKSYDTLTHLYTFHCRFTEPLYPGFALGCCCAEVSLEHTHTTD